MTIQWKQKLRLFPWQAVTLLVGFLLPVLTQASPLKQCQSLVDSRYQALSIERPAETFQQLTPCVDELIATYNPAIFAQEDVQVAELECGLLCRHWDRNILGLANSRAFRGMMIETIEDNLSERHLQILSTAYEGGLSAVVYDTLDDHFKSTPKNRSERRKAKKSGTLPLHRIISNVFDILLTAEVEKAKLLESKYFDFDKRNAFFQKSLNQCLQVSQTVGHISFCVTTMKNYIPLAIGEDILRDTVHRGLLISPALKDRANDVWDQTLKTYEQCLVHYALNTDINKVNVRQYTQACIFQGLLAGFEQAGVILVSHELQKMKLPTHRTHEVVAQGLKQCQPEEIFAESNGSLKLFTNLLSQNPKRFEVYLRRCQISLEEGLVGQLAIDAIKEHPQVKAIMGEQAGPLAQKVVNTHYPVCVQEIKRIPGRSPKDCGGYLIVKSVFEMIEVHASEKIDEILADMNSVSLSRQEKTKLILGAKLKMSSCEFHLAQRTLKEKLTEQQLDREISTCIKPGLSYAVNHLARKVLNHELEKNPIIKQYNVQVGPNITDDSMEKFVKCFDEKIQPANSIEKLMKSIKMATDSCQVVAMLEVVLFVADQVLYQELQRIGLPEKQILTMVNNYKKNENSLHNQIRRASTKEEVDSIAKRAENEVVKGLGSQVLYFLIRKEAGSYLSKNETRGLARDFNRSLIECTKTKTIGSCQKTLTPKVIEAALRLVIPRETAKVFANASKAYLNKSQLRRIDITRTMTYWVAPGKTRMGQRLLDMIVADMQRGRSISSIQKSERVRNLLYEILVNSSRFFETLMFELIQAELDKERKNPSRFLQRLFIRNTSYDWKRIRQIQEGEIVVEHFKKVFRKVVLGGKISNRDFEIAKELVTNGVIKINKRRRN